LGQYDVPYLDTLCNYRRKLDRVIHRSWLSVVFFGHHATSLLEIKEDRSTAPHSNCDDESLALVALVAGI
jgi:hypothetical protein